jgi:hypothetical protein
MSKSILRMLVLLEVVIILQAQTGNGSIVGTVIDICGAVLPGARATLTQTATAQTFTRPETVGSLCLSVLSRGQL